MMDAWLTAPTGGLATHFHHVLKSYARSQDFYLEMPQIRSRDQDFQFALVPTNDFLGIGPESDKFQQIKTVAKDAVMEVKSLSGDPLVIPTLPSGFNANYAHLAVFTLTAPDAVWNQLWAQVATTLGRVLSQGPVYLSTHGTGVYWLHIRFDPKPKYYSYAKFK